MKEMARKIIVANWKMHPASAKEANRLFKEYRKLGASTAADMVVCPPSLYLALAGKGLKLGVQNIATEEVFGQTGEISSTMAKSIGATYVIIGHSERRRAQKETDELINQKVLAALQARLRVILCVGESSQVRAKGFSAAKSYVEAQLAADLKNVPEGSALIIAYEPIWAIGSGTADNPAEAAAMASAITAASGYRVIYGGSVTSQNARDFLQYKEIYGALVGGASLKAGEFKKIINLVTK